MENINNLLLNSFPIFGEIFSAEKSVNMLIYKSNIDGSYTGLVNTGSDLNPDEWEYQTLKADKISILPCDPEHILIKPPVLNELLLLSKYICCKFESYIDDFNEMGVKEFFIYKLNHDFSVTGLVFDRIFSDIIIDEEVIPRNLRNIYEFRYKSGDLEMSIDDDWQVITVLYKYIELLLHVPDPKIEVDRTFIKHGYDRFDSLDVYAGCATSTPNYYIIHLYDIHKIKALPINSSVKETLVEKLQQLGDHRQDWHKDSPVMDIIDPDLAPNYFYNPKESENYLNKREKNDERPLYAWFPVDILINPDKTLELLGPIHNLEQKGNEQLYESITEVFK